MNRRVRGKKSIVEIGEVSNHRHQWMKRRGEEDKDINNVGNSSNTISKDNVMITMVMMMVLERVGTRLQLGGHPHSPLHPLQSKVLVLGEQRSEVCM